MCPDWVGDSGVTGAHFGLVTFSGLWLLGHIMCDKSLLSVPLNLDTSTSLFVIISTIHIERLC